MAYFANASMNPARQYTIQDNNTGQVHEPVYGQSTAMDMAKRLEAQYAGNYQYGNSVGPMVGTMNALGSITQPWQMGGGGSQPYMGPNRNTSQGGQQGWVQQNGMSYGPNGQMSAGGGGMGGGGAAYGSGDIQSLLNKQLAENAWAKNANQSNWNEAKGMIGGLSTGYFNDPVVNQTRQQSQALLNDPYSLNANVVSQMQAKSANQIDNSVNQRMRDAQWMQAMNGQTDMSSMQASAERADRDALAQRVGSQTQIDMQKAIQDKQDLGRAIGVGQQQSGLDQGVRQNQAELFAGTMPQYRADDLSGLIAALGMYNYGANAGGGGSANGYGKATGTDGTAGGQFSGWNMFQPTFGPQQVRGGNDTGAGFNMFDTRPGDRYAEQQYANNKQAENQRNTNSFNQFAQGSWGGQNPYSGRGMTTQPVRQEGFSPNQQKSPFSFNGIQGSYA